MTGFCWISQVDPRRSSWMVSKEHLQTQATVFSYCWTVIVMTAVESYTSIIHVNPPNQKLCWAWILSEWSLRWIQQRRCRITWPLGSFTIQAVPRSFKCAWMKMCKDSSGKEKCGPVKNTGDSRCKVEPLESHTRTHILKVNCSRLKVRIIHHKLSMV